MMNIPVCEMCGALEPDWHAGRAADVTAEIESLRMERSGWRHRAKLLFEDTERLKALLKHADDVVIWEHTPARAGFQEEIETALGIGDQQTPREE